MPNNKQGNGGTAYIAFNAKINVENTQAFLGVIADKLPENTKTLYILFSTSGGSVSQGFVLYNMLRGLPYKIIMHNIGSVDSIGVVIFLAANKRYANKNTTFLIHRAKSSARNDNAEEEYLKEKLSCVQVEQKKIQTVLETRSDISKSDLEKLLNEGQLKDAAYALKSGLIQEVRDFEMPPGVRLLVVSTEAERD